MDMWKGSTPTLAFKFPFKVNTINALTFKCKQGDTVKISKSLSDFSTSGEDILYILLTQADTLALASEEYVTIQFKVQFTNNHVVPSSKMILPVQDVIDTVAMEGTATAELPSMSLNVPFPQVDGGFSVVMGMAVSSGGITSVAWSDITGKPETFPPSSHTHTKSQITDFPNIPSKTSDLTNDSGFITGVSWGDVSNKPSTFTPSSHTHNKSEITDFPTLATVATSGNYGDLSNKPSIPTKTTDLTNDSGFITNAVNDLTNYYLKTGTYSKEEVNNLISAVKQFTYEVVSALPTASASTMNKIYLIPSSSSAVSNVKDEYITIDGGVSASPRYSWEQIGSTSIDLSAYRTSAAQDVIDATLQHKSDNALSTTSKTVTGAINELKQKVLPDATEDGTALVYYDDSWNTTKGFGYYYIDEETIFSDTINASDFISAGSYYTHVYNNLMPIENGKTYSVTFNGVDYECSAFPIPEQINNSVCIGNFSIVRQGAENTGEPFFIGAISLDYPTTITTTSVAINFEPQSAVIFSVSGDVELASKFNADLLPLPTKTSDLTNDSGFLTSHQSLSAYRTASAQDVIDAEKASASVVSSHTSNSDIHVTANQKTAWSGKQDAIDDLSSIRSGASSGSTAVQPSAISDMATKTWVGGQGYLTQHQSLSGYATQTWVNQQGFLTSVDWTAILNKPQTFAPSAHNHDDRYYTETEADSRFLRTHQDISGKENISNKVISMTAQSTDTQYPSAKAVYDEISQLNEDLEDKLDAPSGGSVGQVLKKTASGTEWANESGGGGGGGVDYLTVSGGKICVIYTE